MSFNGDPSSPGIDSFSIQNPFSVSAWQYYGFSPLIRIAAFNSSSHPDQVFSGAISLALVVGVRGENRNPPSQTCILLVQLRRIRTRCVRKPFPLLFPLSAS
jgi:hypothetical protein